MTQHKHKTSAEIAASIAEHQRKHPPKPKKVVVPADVRIVHLRQVVGYSDHAHPIYARDGGATIAIKTTPHEITAGIAIVHSGKIDSDGNVVSRADAYCRADGRRYALEALESEDSRYKLYLNISDFSKKARESDCKIFKSDPTSVEMILMAVNLTSLKHEWVARTVAAAFVKKHKSLKSAFGSRFGEC